MIGDVLSTAFFDRGVEVVARELLGKLLIRHTRQGPCMGRIVETEAYLARGDPACHSYRGRTKKNASMFGPPGRAYVYPIHARYCMNAVTEAKGVASAVLLRAVEPLAGIQCMRQRRGTESVVDLCRGPARLCQAFAIDRRLDGWRITSGERLWIASPVAPNARRFTIGQSVRIGVTSGKESQLRFYVAGSPFVSGPGRLRQ